MKKIILIFIYVQTSLLLAQDRFVIQNVTLFDGESITKNSSVLVENGIVSEVGPKSYKDFKVIDGTGKFLMPGMTNAHVHAFNPLVLTQAARAGVLNVLDMHGMEPMQKFMVSLKDSTNYARYFRAGHAATAPGGHGTQYGFTIPTLERPEDAQQWVKDRVEAGVDYIKIIIEPWKKTLDLETVAQIIAEGHKNDKVVVAHVSKENDAYETIKSGIDGLVHIYSDKEMPNDKFEEITTNPSFFIIPTILTIVKIQPLYYDKTEEETQKIKMNLLREVKRYYDAGIPILAGTDPPNANINMGTDLYQELSLLSEAGIPALDILKSATSHPAQSFKLEKLGFIKAGYIADLLLLDKNPLYDITNISSISKIWKAGKLIN